MLAYKIGSQIRVQGFIDGWDGWVGGLGSWLRQDTVHETWNRKAGGHRERLRVRLLLDRIWIYSLRIMDSNL